MYRKTRAVNPPTQFAQRPAMNPVVQQQPQQIQVRIPLGPGPAHRPHHRRRWGFPRFWRRPFWPVAYPVAYPVPYQPYQSYGYGAGYPPGRCQYNADSDTVTCNGRTFRANVLNSSQTADGTPVVLVASPAFAGPRWVELV